MAAPFRQVRTPYGGDVTLSGRNATPEAAAALIQSQIQPFQMSANAPIPGLTGPVGSGGSIPGFSAPPQWNGLVPSYQQLPTQSMSQMPQMPMGGPYSMQAMRMAGLLGSPQGMSAPMGGLLGKGYRIPGIK